MSCFYAPNFEEVEEAYWFGPVHAWVTLCIRSRMVRDRILKFGMWNCIKNKRTHIFFSFPSDFSLQSYAPFLTFFFYFAIISLLVPCQQNLENRFG